MSPSANLYTHTAMGLLEQHSLDELLQIASENRFIRAYAKDMTHVHMHVLHGERPIQMEHGRALTFLKSLMETCPPLGWRRPAA